MAALALVILILAVLLLVITGNFSSGEKKVLTNGSTLILTSISFAGTSTFLHGTQLEKLLNHALPANGVTLWKFKLARPAPLTFTPPPGKSLLVAEFKLAGTNAQLHPFVNPAFYHQFRCIIQGDRGIDYVHELQQFKKYADGYFGYVVASRYPRDADWLWLKIERHAVQGTNSLWSPVAEFKIKNESPSRSQKMPWTLLITNVSVGDLTLASDGITVSTQAFPTADIWKHIVTAPFHVTSNGLALTNWEALYVRVEDASGNWDYGLASHRSLDPRYVWKLDADFEPAIDLPRECVLTLPLSNPGVPIITNFANQPITISWDNDFLDVTIPTNQPNVALRYLSVADAQGEPPMHPSGSWGQHRFRKGNFMWRRNDTLISGGKPTSLTLAIVTNVHATFYVQPVLVR